MKHLALLVSASMLAACGGLVVERADDGAGGGSGLVTDASPPPGSSGKTPPPAPPPEADASTVVEFDAAPSAPVAEACGRDLGPSAPEKFASWFYSHELPGCSGASKCAVFMQLDAKCSLMVQSDDAPRTLVMSPDDCLHLRSWLTSDALLRALASPELCRGVPELGNPDSNEISLVSGPLGGRKTPAQCLEAPLDRHRACLQSVLDRYTPGVRL